MATPTANQGIPLPDSTDADNVPYAFAQAVGVIEPRLNMRFASATARDAILTSPLEGMVAWLQDVNVLTVYNGSAWMNVAENYNAATYDTGWITAATGFTAAANFTLVSQRYRKVGNLVDLIFNMTRSTSTLTVPADGDISNVAILSAIPSTLIPAQTSYWASALASGGRLEAGTISSAGVVSLSALSPGASLAIGDVVAGRAMYFSD